MKAPDKIYIRESNVGLSDMWYQEKRLLPSIFATHEYIRKDALMEWANKELEMRRNTGDDYFYPAIVVLDGLIDKLNSL